MGFQAENKSFPKMEAFQNRLLEGQDKEFVLPTIKDSYMPLIRRKMMKALNGDSHKPLKSIIDTVQNINYPPNALIRYKKHTHKKTIVIDKIDFDKMSIEERNKYSEVDADQFLGFSNGYTGKVHPKMKNMKSCIGSCNKHELEFCKNSGGFVWRNVMNDELYPVPLVNDDLILMTFTEDAVDKKLEETEKTNINRKGEKTRERHLTPIAWTIVSPQFKRFFEAMNGFVGHTNSMERRVRNKDHISKEELTLDGLHVCLKGNFLIANNLEKTRLAHEGSDIELDEGMAEKLFFVQRHDNFGSIDVIALLYMIGVLGVVPNPINVPNTIINDDKTLPFTRTHWVLPPNFLISYFDRLFFESLDLAIDNLEKWADDCTLDTTTNRDVLTHMTTKGAECFGFKAFKQPQKETLTDFTLKPVEFPGLHKPGQTDRAIVSTQLTLPKTFSAALGNQVHNEDEELAQALEKSMIEANKENVQLEEAINRSRIEFAPKDAPIEELAFAPKDTAGEELAFAPKDTAGEDSQSSFFRIIKFLAKHEEDYLNMLDKRRLRNACLAALTAASNEENATDILKTEFIESQNGSTSDTRSLNESTNELTEAWGDAPIDDDECVINDTYHFIG